MLPSLKKVLGRLFDQPLPTGVPSPPRCIVSVVLGSYNRKHLLPHVIESVRNQGASFPYEMIVIDGGSTDGSLEWLLTQKDIVTIVQHNRGEFRGQPVRRRSWGYFMNLGFKAAQGKYILMLSDDCLLLPGAMQRGVETFDETLQNGRQLGGLAFYFRNWPQEDRYYVQYTLGGNLMVNHGLFLRSAMEKVGWVDEERYLFYKADGDLCLKLWHQGYCIQDCPGAFVEHFFDENENVRQSNNTTLANDRAAYLQRWNGIYYHRGQTDARRRLCQDFIDPQRSAEKTWSDLRAA